MLDRVESGIGEPGGAGVSAALADYRASWQNLSNNPGNEAARSQVLAAAETVVNAFAVQFSGSYHTLLLEHADRPGVIAQASISAPQATIPAPATPRLMYGPATAGRSPRRAFPAFRPA